jgi:hypothetical protein
LANLYLRVDLPAQERLPAERESKRGVGPANAKPDAKINLTIRWLMPSSKFDSLSPAIRFAQRQGINYRVHSHDMHQKEHRRRVDGREEKPMVQWKKRAIHDQRNPLQESDRVEATRASVRDQNTKSELDRRLDQALLETLPASDSISIMIC